jgi:hypothetical protein
MTENNEKNILREDPGTNGAVSEGLGAAAALTPAAAPEAAIASAKKMSRKTLITIISLVVAAAVLALGLHALGIFKFPWEKDPAPIVAGDLFPGEGGADGGHLPNMTPEEILAQMQKVADASYFSFKINARPEFDNGSAAGTLGIENPSNNVYPMVVQIFLDSTNELIYDSGGILPDQHILKAKLRKNLKAGTYKATAYMNAYDPDTKEWLGKQAAALEITIKE